MSNMFSLSQDQADFNHFFIQQFSHPKNAKIDCAGLPAAGGFGILVWAERPLSRRLKLHQQRIACKAGGLRPDG